MAGLNLIALKGKKREQNDSNDWGGYMQSKIRKLDEQFNVMENSDDNESIVQNNLFKDIVIFVNGYTVPSSDQLKRLMKQYGGGYQHYYSKSKCTHIIATNLPDSKIKELRISFADGEVIIWEYSPIPNGGEYFLRITEPRRIIMLIF